VRRAEGAKLRTAGRTVRLRMSAIITPTGAKNPSIATDSRPAVAKEASPAAVVTLVRTRASPECPSAWTRASSRDSPARICSKKTESR
jgi:hypothetical protein